MTKLNAGKASVLVLTAAFAVATFLLGKAITPAIAGKPEKITICHAKPADTAANGWVSINVSKKAIVTGNSKHATEHDADIIPLFTYDFDGGGTFTGKNWDTTGQAVWDNGCKTPSPTVSPTPTPEPCVDGCETSSPSPTPTTFDACPNLDGIQETVPDGYDVDEQDNCVPEPTPTPTPGDVCTNIDGFQGSVPDGWFQISADSTFCRQFQYGGPPPPPAAGGQVLGASTMAGTGSFTESLYLAIMTLGGTLFLTGYKNFKKALRKA